MDCRRPAAQLRQMGRLETQWLAAPANLSALSNLSGQWIDIVHGRRPPTLIAVHTLYPSCGKAEKAPIHAPVRESPGESRLSYCTAADRRDRPLKIKKQHLPLKCHDGLKIKAVHRARGGLPALERTRSRDRSPLCNFGACTLRRWKFRSGQGTEIVPAAYSAHGRHLHRRNNPRMGRGRPVRATYRIAATRGAQFSQRTNFPIRAHVLRRDEETAVHK